MILCECKYCIPSAICLDQETKRDGNMTCSSFSIFCNGPYGQNSMMMQKTGDCVQTPLSVGNFRFNIGFFWLSIISATHLNLIMFSWSSLRRCLMSVSFSSLTFFTATISFFSFPLKTAPWAPLPNHSRSVMDSNGFSQSSLR